MNPDEIDKCEDKRLTKEESQTILIKRRELYNEFKEKLKTLVN